MKTMVRRLLLASGIGALLILTACGTKTGLIGKWDRDMPPESGRKYLRVEFKADGEYWAADQFVCEYRIDGDTLIMDYGANEETYRYAIDGNILTITDGETTAEYTRVEE